MSWVPDTWYLLTSADHNIVQVNKITAAGKVGDKASDLRESHPQSHAPASGGSSHD